MRDEAGGSDDLIMAVITWRVGKYKCGLERVAGSEREADGSGCRVRRSDAVVHRAAGGSRVGAAAGTAEISSALLPLLGIAGRTDAAAAEPQLPSETGRRGFCVGWRTG